MDKPKRGGKREGAGRPPLAEVRVKLSVTLTLAAIQSVEERRLPGEKFSTALDRILTALPSPPAPGLDAAPR